MSMEVHGHLCSGLGRAVGLTESPKEEGSEVASIRTWNSIVDPWICVLEHEIGRDLSGAFRK